MRESQALRDLDRQITNAACGAIFLDTREVDDPPGTCIAEPQVERERRFRKEPACSSRNINHTRQRHQIVSRRAETMEQHDEGAVSASLTV